MKIHEHILSTGSGGLIVALLATPFDVIKTRLIAQTLHAHDRSCFYRYCEGVWKDVCVTCGYEHPPQYVYRGLCQRELYSGSLDAVMKISRNEGLSALWNGIGPTLVMIVPSAILYFSMFDFMKQKGRTVVHEKYHSFVPSAAGTAARLINIGIFSPIELIRTKAQSEKSLDYSKLRQSLKVHVKEYGVRSLWDGAKSQMFRDVPFTIVYWYIQDRIKRRMQAEGSGTISSNLTGAVAGGAVAAVITHPFDLTKTQLQSNIGIESPLGRPGLMNQLLKIYRGQGFRGLFVGLTPRMIKVMPSCAIFITSFEGLKEYFERNNS